MRTSILLLATLVAALGFWKYRATMKRQQEAMNPPSFAQRFDEALKELKTTEITPGSGKEAKRGEKVIIHYESSLPNGEVFDSSRNRKQSVSFTLGVAEALPAWDYGIAGMKVGGKRRIDAPPFLAYGESGVAGAVPANSRVVFEVELIGVGDSKAKPKVRSKSKASSKKNL